MPAYLTISRAFRIGHDQITGNYSGLVIASADALHLLVGRNAMRMGMEAGGGAVGGLVAALLESRAAGQPLAATAPRVIETRYDGLPLEVTTDRDWPVKSHEGPVLVILREDVESMRYSFWQWGIFLTVDGLDFRLEPPFFKRQATLDWLREQGWPLETA